MTEENVRRMFIVTFNGSSWLSDTEAELEGISGKDKASFRDFMQTTIGDINLLQEHRLQGRLFQFQVSRLQRSGWKVYGCPGVQLES
eukprot:3486749-Pyramimonas_sp.AAC.1